jgi:deazaflavin-dependent oxidoreductase (nitroreductase family)
MSLQDSLRHAWLVTLKHTLNPLTRRMAKSHFGPFALVQHVGRRSGKPYETPIIVAPVADGFVIELTYGPGVDWYKNVRAAGGCVLVRHGRAYTIERLEPLDTAAGLAAFPRPQRTILRLLRRRHFERMVMQASLG